MTEQDSLSGPEVPDFNDGKAPDALRTIGEVSNALDIRQHVLRYWEEQFPTLKPLKRSGGRRYYRPEDVRLLVTINRLVHQEGYTLRGARLAIEGSEVQAAAPPAPASVAVSRDDLMPRLQAVRDALAEALADA